MPPEEMMGDIVGVETMVRRLDLLHLLQDRFVEVFQAKPERGSLKAGRLLQSELLRQEAIPAAGIDDPPGLKRHRTAAFGVVNHLVESALGDGYVRDGAVDGFDAEFPRALAQ